MVTLYALLLSLSWRKSTDLLKYFTIQLKFVSPETSSDLGELNKIAVSGVVAINKIFRSATVNPSNDP